MAVDKSVSKSVSSKNYPTISRKCHRTAALQTEAGWDTIRKLSENRKSRTSPENLEKRVLIKANPNL